jgi:hypothetical protein
LTGLPSRYPLNATWYDSHFAAIVSPVQKRLPLFAPAVKVAGWTILAQLSDVS